MRLVILFLFTCTSLLTIPAFSAQDEKVTIVVLGSSTAAGAGPTFSSNAWVNRYRSYLQSINQQNEVINLAVGGYKTYQIMPTGFIPPWGSVDTEKNITKALSYNPDAIIINLPSNDAVSGIPVEEQLSNYEQILGLADNENIPVWITTTQPRWVSKTATQNLMEMKDSTFYWFGDKSIDFWNGIANEDGTVKSKYDSGDHTHLNDEAHGVLFNRIVDARILEFITNSNFQAEDYNQATNVEIETEYKRNSNRGFVKIQKKTSASVLFKVSAKNTTSLDVIFRHSNQNGTVTGDLYVNGVAQFNKLLFTPTKSEETWDKVASEVELLQGENTIEIKFTEQEEDIFLDFMAWNNDLVSYDISTANSSIAQKEKEVVAYPVPFCNCLTLNNIPENATVTLYSVMGLKMMETKVLNDRTNLNTSEFIPGVYFLQVTGKDCETKTLRLVKR